MPAANNAYCALPLFRKIITLMSLIPENRYTYGTYYGEPKTYNSYSGKRVLRKLRGGFQKVSGSVSPVYGAGRPIGNRQAADHLGPRPRRSDSHRANVARTAVALGTSGAMHL